MNLRAKARRMISYTFRRHKTCKSACVSLQRQTLRSGDLDSDQLKPMLIPAIGFRTVPPSVFPHLSDSPLPSGTNLNGNLDPSLESYGDPPIEARSGTFAHSTATWAKTLPYSRNHIHANGNSVAGSPLQHDGLRGGFPHTSPPTSPQAAYRQPIYRPAEYQSFGSYQGASPPKARPLSVHSTNSGYPPLPHYPQPHFYRAPDLDFGTAKSGGEDTSAVDGCSVFDSLPSGDNETSTLAGNVFLVGVQHGLDVYHIGQRHLDRIGRINDLRGSAIAATILPGANGEALLPAKEHLAALVVHRPCIPSNQNLGNDAHDDGRDEFDASGSMIQALQVAEGNRYRTSVEIYSLSQGKRIATLFNSPEVEAQVSRSGGKVTPPPPVGRLTIQARGRFITVNSGTSGEIFIYERYQSSPSDPHSNLRCIGKTWTRVTSKKSRSGSVSSRDSSTVHEDDHMNDQLDLPIVSLSSRWLSVVAPVSSSQTSLHGYIPDSLGTKIPGGSSHAAPTEPQITCQLDTLEDEGFLNKMARDATQEFVKGARWIGSQGLQAWNSYWSKPSEPGVASTSPENAYATAPSAQHAFPPTHAQDGGRARTRNQPALVAILDLERLSQSQNQKEAIALQPLATFSLPHGCSMVSFAPNGLQLFTASAKGDVQQVWDLMRIIHGDSGLTANLYASSGPLSVREVARFTRITEARIIDVVWAKPRGERFAMVTDNGTVHLYDLPSSAFYWPPSWQTKRMLRANTKATESDSQHHEREHSEPSRSAMNSAFSMLTGKAYPMLSAVRGRTASAGSSFNAFGGFASTAGVGAKGGKAVAAGINRSFSAAASGTVNTIRYLGENRITLPGFSESIAPGCVRWMNSKEETLLAVTASGLIRIYSVRQSNNPKAGKRRPSAIGNKPAEFTIPRYSPSSNHKDLSKLEDTPNSLGSFWKPLIPRISSRNESPAIQPLSHAEIETHAPYQPFHTDRRVGFFIYSGSANESDPHHLRGEAPWVFGEAIPASKLNLGRTAADDNDKHLDRTAAVEMENIVRMEGNEEEGQQIVVTTRRKRQRIDEETAKEDNGGFFEDDLEVVDFAHNRV